MHLSGLTRLRRLVLWGTNITDAGLAHLQHLPRLEELWLDGTRVTDHGLVYLKGLTQLKDLQLDKTGVTNAGLVHLQGLTQLKELHLKNTNVSAAGAAGLKKFIPACQIFTEPAGMSDLEKWQGLWVETACEWNGKNVAFDARRSRWTTTIQGNRSFVVDADGAPIEAHTFKLLPGQTPKAIDVQVTQGPNAGQRNAGIYLIDGDNLKICWTIAGQDARLNSRPSAARGSASRRGHVRADRRLLRSPIVATSGYSPRVNCRISSAWPGYRPASTERRPCS